MLYIITVLLTICVADCPVYIKVAGSGLESTGIFFQAALEFLHGAFLLEPDNNEDRNGEMSPNGVYNTTANLCEYVHFTVDFFYLPFFLFSFEIE